MKPTNRTPRPRRTTTPAAGIPLILRKPFSHPIPVQDELVPRFGPQHPVPATQQTQRRGK